MSSLYFNFMWIEEIYYCGCAVLGFLKELLEPALVWLAVVAGWILLVLFLLILFSNLTS